MQTMSGRRAVVLGLVSCLAASVLAALGAATLLGLLVLALATA